MNKDKGWDYLNSDDKDGNGAYFEEDGSWEYKNADGSSTYYGEDGSWGYKNADGSGSYYGEDGSWGYKNADGSGSYYGEDGSWGYKNADGSGSFYGSDNSSVCYDSDDDSDDYSYDSDSGGLVEVLSELTTNLGILAIAKHSAKVREEARLEEERRFEEERILREKQEIKRHERSIRNKRIKAMFFNGKKLQINFSTRQLIGENLEDVLNILKETGFNKVKAIPIKDIYTERHKRVNEVEQVVVNGNSWFEANEQIPYDAEIIVTYHMKKEFVMPYSSRQMVERNYEELVQELIDIGFTEIYGRPLEDLKTGWIRKDQSVQKVIVGEEENVKRGRSFEYDTKILIMYHSFAKK